VYSVEWRWAQGFVAHLVFKIYSAWKGRKRMEKTERNILAVVSSWGKGFLEQIGRQEFGEVTFDSPEGVLGRQEFFAQAQAFDVIIVELSCSGDRIEIERHVVQQLSANGATLVFLVSPLASFGKHFASWLGHGLDNMDCVVQGTIIVNNYVDQKVLRAILPDDVDVKPHLVYDPKYSRFFILSDEEGKRKAEYSARRTRSRFHLYISSNQADKPLIFLGNKERGLNQDSVLEACLITGHDKCGLEPEDLIAGVDLVISSSPNDLITAACCRVPAITLRERSAEPFDLLTSFWPAKLICPSRLSDFIGDRFSWSNVCRQQKILFPNPWLSSQEMCKKAASSLRKIIEHLSPQVSFDSEPAFARTKAMSS